MDVPRIRDVKEVEVENLVNGLKRIRIGDYIGPIYKHICNLLESEGKLAYAAQIGIGWTIGVEGKLSFATQKEDKRWLVNVDGKEGPKYEHVWDLIGVSGRFAYAAVLDNGRHLVNANNQEGPEYAHVWDLMKADSKFLYAAETEDGKELINFDGEEIFDKNIEDITRKYGHVLNLGF